MAKQKKPVHRVQMTEGKRNIIHQLLEEYDIQTTALQRQRPQKMPLQRIPLRQAMKQQPQTATIQSQ